MMSRPFMILSCALAGFAFCSAHAQTVSNITCSNALVESVLIGDYDPQQFTAGTVVDDHGTILCELRTALSADSLKEHLRHIVGFGTRNSYSDTVSETQGIGAARRWAQGCFARFSEANEGRLLPAYLTFDMDDDVCGPLSGTKNVLAVLPGRSLADSGIVLIEAHLDSRCADNCDPACAAPGAEDNGSGSALVIELARVMSRYTFDHTIVFMLTTAEEHGLLGATAMAKWCVQRGIPIKGVQNNDVVGGIWCGATSSDPGCEVENEADSLEVRLFSQGAANRPHRGFARTIKMYYAEKMSEEVPVAMDITVMPMEDRENRGGDHIPFREEDFRNVRFTAAHEHGDADVSDTAYHDRQHTSNDILGVDTDGDLVIDSFFVDFNYLQRNAVINGMTATLMALGPEPPAFTVLDEPNGLRVEVQPTADLMEWRIGVRQGTTTPDFLAVYRTDQTSFPIPGLAASTTYFISVAGIDSAGIMSPFSHESVKLNDADTPPGSIDDLPYGLACTPIGMPAPMGFAASDELQMTVSPNPVAGPMIVSLDWPVRRPITQGELVLRDALGRVTWKEPWLLGPGANQKVVTGACSIGLLSLVLEIDGRRSAVARLVGVR